MQQFYHDEQEAVVVAAGTAGDVAVEVLVAVEVSVVVEVVAEADIAAAENQEQTTDQEIAAAAEE